MLAHHPRGMARQQSVFISEGGNLLKYLWMVVQDLFLTVTYTTWMHAVLSRLFGRKGRLIHAIALGAGSLASVVLAIVKYNTRLIISSHWNHYLYAVMILLSLAFLVLCLLFGRRENGKMGVGGAALSAVGACLSAVLVFYALPGVLLYPFSFNTMGNGYLSAYYMTRLAGWLAALLLLLVYSRLLYHGACHIKPYALLAGLLNVGFLSYCVYCFGRFFVPWVNRAKWLGWSVKYTDAEFGWIGKLMMFTANYSMLFIWICAGLAALLALFFFRQGLKIDEPYDNPAQLRKLKARNRRYRRTAVGALLCALLCVGILTLVKGYDTRVVELSAPETYTVEDGKILIPLESVNDGHLHRFEYRTEKNIDVRWIVVKKPNSASYGVGLDACDVCGNAGYFERNGQIICKRCDVVMNINTIGFKGGCNPIPLAYEVSGGSLIFKLEDIIAGEKEFR